MRYHEVNRFISLKIGDIIQPLLNSSNPLQLVTWYSANIAITDIAGQTIVTYIQTPLQARVQPVSHDLMFKEQLEFGYIYKRFYVLTNTVQTPDRNISTNGDFIFWNGLYYRVMKLPDEFLTGWQEVIGMQSTGLLN